MTFDYSDKQNNDICVVPLTGEYHTTEKGIKFYNYNVFRRDKEIGKIIYDAYDGQYKLALNSTSPLSANEIAEISRHMQRYSSACIFCGSTYSEKYYHSKDICYCMNAKCAERGNRLVETLQEIVDSMSQK